MNFVEHLQGLAQRRPHDTWLTVVGDVDGVVTEQAFTYAVFERRVRALAALLQARFAVGDRALVMLDNDDHYAVSMLACFYAGVIAVPVFPPESNRPQHLQRLDGVAEDAQACCVLTSTALVGTLAFGGGSVATLPRVAVDAVDQIQADAWVPHRPDGNDVAFLQYTSGSTSAPKGVMVTHGNLMANERAIQASMGIGPDDKFVSWSPLYHDMGLIGGLLQPLYSAIPLVLTSPRHFLERPVRWLELIARHRGTVSGGPDFAYRLCIERVKPAQRSALDLSSWRVAYTGAEPVRADTVTAFSDAFSDAGFDPQAMYPCYGLAEATLFVTGGRRGDGMVSLAFDAAALAQGRAVVSDEGSSLVGCGDVADGHEVAIVDPVSQLDSPSGVVGEIWAGGPSIGAGYWRRLQETEDSFVERTGRRWLRTGDLGFRHGGQLYVTGRIKDVIIVRGHNVYPQDIERVIEAEVDAVRQGRVAAFRVRGADGEGIGVAAEVSRAAQKRVAPRQLVDALGAAVSEMFGEPVSAVALLNPGALPRTSSGKLQRAACRAGWETRSLDAYALFDRGTFLFGEADAPASVAVTDVTTLALAAIWAEVLKWLPGRIPASDTHFFTNGGNSLAAAQVAARVAGHWNIVFSTRDLFERPTLSACAALVRERSDATSGGTRSRPAITAIPPASRDAPLPMSHAQRRQWVMWQLAPHSDAYHVGGQIALDGRLNVDALRGSLTALVSRHESLRTVFQGNALGQGEQRVLPAGEHGLEQVDLHHLPPSERKDECRRIVEAFQRRPFDLRSGPVWRTLLLTLDETSRVLVVVAHHIAVDGLSMNHLVDDLVALYGQGSGAGESLPGELPVQPADCAAREQSWIEGDDAQRQLAYWRERLGRAHPVLALPVDHAPPGGPAFQAAVHGFTLPPELATAVREGAAEAGTTVFAVLLSALQALLYRCSGQQDIRVGVPVGTRHLAGTERSVGLFVNTIVVRTQVDGRMTLAELLTQAARHLRDGQDHSDMPFDRIVEALQPERNAGHSPLFQVLLNQVPDEVSFEARAAGLAGSVETLRWQATQFDLSVEVRERRQGGIDVAFVHAQALFNPATIERMGRLFIELVTAMVGTPHVRLGNMAFTHEFQDTADAPGLRRQPPPAAETAARVHERIAARAAAHPGRVVLVSGDEQLTHAELEGRANRLAHRLIALGVGAETRVGIAVERSPDMVVALLAVLKAGAAYVPIDPALPSDRIAYMVKDSGLRLLLSGGLPLGAFVPPEGVQTHHVPASDLVDESAAAPEVFVHPEQPAYMMYTSGSTGQPKGVMVRHGALSNLLASLHHAPGMHEHDVLVAETSLSFDIAGVEIFLPLMVGATLVLASREQARDGIALAGLIDRSRATVFQATPAGWRLLLAGGWAGAQGRPFTGLCGGEALQPDLARALLERGVDLWNLYGPTETTVYSSGTQVDPRRIAIGGPVAGTWLRVLDADLQQVPAGVAGELYIGGEGLARGYGFRPGLTADRFVADPLGHAGERLYRTGDLVRWPDGGSLEYLGRIDHQVKIRGFRIELGEIEAALLSIEAIREAVVVARPDGTGGSRLVAYVVGEGAEAALGGALKAALARTLPEHMLPTAFVALERLPVSPNGKVDRKALPIPEIVGTQPYEAPRGAVAEALAGIWSEVLSVARVGIHDNFFDLGGHSALLIRVHHLLESRLHTGVSVVDLFKHPTIDGLVRRIEQGHAPSPASGESQERALRQRALRTRRRQTSEGTI